MNEVTVFKCEICGKTGSKEVISTHEVECLEKRKRTEELCKEYQRKTEERLEQARKIARESKAIRLLCLNGLDADAKTLCRAKASYLWDCGTSHGWEDVYNAMIQEAYMENGKIPKNNP